MTSTSNIGLGSLSTSSTGSTSLGSTLFGIDINSLVDNLVEARSIPNTQRDVKITENTAKIAAYSEFSSLLTTLKTAADGLRNPRVTSGTADLFEAKQTTSRASGSIEASSLYGVSATSSALTGTYSITINRIASTDTVSGTAGKADTGTTAAMTADGSLNINGTAIILTSTMTLTQVKDAINAQTGTTKVRAEIVQAGTSDYRIVLKATTTGDAIDVSTSDASVLTDLGLANSGKTDSDLSASIILDGVTVTRTSNSITDLISGVSLELYQADVGKPITLTIDNDLSSISDSISAFLAAYNDVANYVKDQRAVGSDGSVGEDQLLYNDNLLVSTYRGLQNALGIGATGIDSGNLKNLRDIGIDLTSDGLLEVMDESLFEDALLTKFDQVRSLFGFGDTATAGLEVVDRPDNINSALLGTSITVKVLSTDSNGLPTAAEFVVGSTTYSATISNGFIRGATGTPLEGFTIGYTGGVLTSPATYTGTFTPTQGIADQVSALLEPIVNTTTGTIKQASDALTDKNTKLQEQSDKLSDQLELYRDRLLLQFQAAQSAISALESQKNSIASYVDSLNGSN